MRKSRKATQLLSYFGGLFDGEGTVGIYYGGGTYYLKCAIYNKFLYPLGLIHKEFPGASLLYPKSTGTFQLRYNHYKAQEFMEAILPYTIIKYEQLKVAISFLNHRRRDHQKKKSGLCDRCDRFVETIKKLKQRNGVNSVNPMREYRAKPEDVELDAQYVQSLWEGVETSGELSTSNKPSSAPAKDIVHQ